MCVGLDEQRQPVRLFEPWQQGDTRIGFIDLLPWFKETDRFPLFFEADPHWNPTGATFVAERVFALLVEQRLIPCALDEEDQNSDS